MSHYLVNKSTLSGKMTVPSSKSHTLRAILFGALGRGESVISNYLHANDTHSMIRACQSFGAKIQTTPNELRIIGTNGKIPFAEDVIDAGNSGIVLRFCTAVGALSGNPVVVTGDHSIRHQRPMKPLIDGLIQLGAKITSMRGDNHAPIIVHGPIRSGSATLYGEDSQPVSALLIAAAFARGPIELHVINAGEKPWIGLTLDWFERLGISYTNDRYKHYRLEGNNRYDGFDYTVPGDLSSAAFPIAAALITHSELTLQNIDMQDSQGDKELISIFQKMGANIEIDPIKNELIIKKSPKLSGIEVDINNFVDAITILAVVACYAEGETWIRNGSIARQKECNRLQSIVTELKKMGANIIETEDGLRITGSKLTGGAVASYHDHRMAMSLSIAALGAEGPTTIASTECVSKTFPSFQIDLNRLGAQIKTQ